MTQNSGVGGKQGETAASGGLRDRLAHERHDARATVDSVREDVSDKASQLAADARAAAEEKLEGAQHGIGAGLKSIGGALRAAGDHLSNEHQGTASRIARDAAAGLDRLSDTLQHRSLDEVVGELRGFGRRNAGGLFAGSLLAGLAVGRLMKLGAGSGADNRAEGSASTAGAGTRDSARAATDPVRPDPGGGSGTPVSPTGASPGASPAPSMTPGAPAGATGTVPPAAGGAR